MLHAQAERPDQQVVVLSQVLATEVNIGYEDFLNTQVCACVFCARVCVCVPVHCHGRANGLQMLNADFRTVHLVSLAHAHVHAGCIAQRPKDLQPDFIAHA